MISYHILKALDLMEEFCFIYIINLYCVIIVGCRNNYSGHRVAIANSRTYNAGLVLDIAMEILHQQHTRYDKQSASTTRNRRMAICWRNY